MARTHGTAWPWLLADNSERIIGLRVRIHVVNAERRRYTRAQGRTNKSCASCYAIGDGDNATSGIGGN